MTKHDLITDLLRLVDTPPSPEGDSLPEYDLVFKEGYREGVSHALKIVMKHSVED